MRVSTRSFGDSAEREFALMIDGICITGSGSGRRKGDVESSDTLWQVKASEKETFRVTPVLLGKIWEDALTKGKAPGLALALGNPRVWVVFLSSWKPLEEYEVIPTTDLFMVRRSDILSGRLYCCSTYRGELLGVPWSIFRRYKGKDF